MGLHRSVQRAFYNLARCYKKYFIYNQKSELTLDDNIN